MKYELKLKTKHGYYFIILAAALSALVHIISKPMLEQGISIEVNPIVMTFLVYMICGVFFTPVARKTGKISKFSQKDIIFMALIGFSEVAALSTYFFGMQNSTAVNASLFSNSEIIFSLVIAMLVFKERLNIKECIPFSMIIIGMMVIPIGNEIYQNNFSLHHIVTGDLLVIASGFLYAVDITICKYIGDRYDARRVTQITSFFCTIFALAFIFILNIPFDFDITYLPNIAVISILGTGMSTLLFLAALRLIGAVKTIILYSTTSVFGILFAGIILSEEITTIDIISLIITLTGIFLLRNKLAESEDIQTFPETGKSMQNFEQIDMNSESKRHNLDFYVYNNRVTKLLNIISIFGNHGKRLRNSHR